jgi:hypothetical protein
MIFDASVPDEDIMTCTGTFNAKDFEIRTETIVTNNKLDIDEYLHMHELKERLELDLKSVTDDISRCQL